MATGVLLAEMCIHIFLMTQHAWEWNRFTAVGFMASSVIREREFIYGKSPVGGSYQA
jgi:hypothetical protein